MMSFGGASMKTFFEHPVFQWEEHGQGDGEALTLISSTASIDTQAAGVPSV
jgi:hypothetical protein